MTSVFFPVCLTSVFFMEQGQETANHQALPKPVPSWKKAVSNTLKSMRISYMNWTYLPRSTGEEENIPQRLLHGNPALCLLCLQSSLSSRWMQNGDS